MGSIASASVANRALSETSKKGMATDSPEIDYLGYDADLSTELRNVEMVLIANFIHRNFAQCKFYREHENTQRVTWMNQATSRASLHLS